MQRRLFTFVAILSLVLCLAATSMWARSVVWGDRLLVRGGHEINIRSEHGLISANISSAEDGSEPEWRHDAWRHGPGRSPWNGGGPRWWNRIGFAHYSGWNPASRQIHQYVVPYYFLVVVTGLLPLLFVVRRFVSSRQFSLRTLLIGKTLVAVGLGWIVYMLRS